MMKLHSKNQAVNLCSNFLGKIDNIKIVKKTKNQKNGFLSWICHEFTKLSKKLNSKCISNKNFLDVVLHVL